MDDPIFHIEDTDYTDHVPFRKLWAVISIDPGATGAVAIQFERSDTPAVRDTPVTKIVTKKKNKKKPVPGKKFKKFSSKTKTEYDDTAMNELIVSMVTFAKSKGYQIHICIEKVHAMAKMRSNPKTGQNEKVTQGAVSSFNFGAGFGVWRGIMAATRLPRTFVTPQAWKKTQLAGKSKEKDQSRIRAIELWPKLHEELKRKMDVDRADALLIGRHVLNELIGQNT